MWGAFGADRWNFIVIVFNYSATVKAFVIYLTELLRVAKQRHEFFTFFVFFQSAHLVKTVAQGRIFPMFSYTFQMGTYQLVCERRASSQGLFWDDRCWVHHGGGGNSSSLV